MLNSNRKVRFVTLSAQSVEQNGDEQWQPAMTIEWVSGGIKEIVFPELWGNQRLAMDVAELRLKSSFSPVPDYGYSWAED